MLTKSSKRLEHVLNTPTRLQCFILELNDQFERQSAFLGPLKFINHLRPKGKGVHLKKLVSYSSGCFLTLLIFDHTQCPIVEFVSRRSFYSKTDFKGIIDFG